MFKVKIILGIVCMDFDSVKYALCTDENNELPSIYVGIGDDLKTVAGQLFLHVTGLSPSWANLQFLMVENREDEIVLFYNSLLCPEDKMLNGYKWNFDISNIKEYKSDEIARGTICLPG